MKKQKCLYLWPKMPYLGIFDKNCLIWIFLGYNFKKSIVIFEISSLKYCEKTKIPKFGMKNALFVFFWGRIQKNNCHIWNQHLEFSIIAKFCEKMKMPIFGTKNALSGYSWPRIKKKLLSELKSAHSNWSISKTSQQKCLNFGPKMLYLGIFDKNALFGFFGQGF